jgi:hypothetical protein
VYFFTNVVGTWKVNKTGVTTFYDSVCGIPLFRAPVGRTFAEWEVIILAFRNATLVCCQSCFIVFTIVIMGEPPVF